MPSWDIFEHQTIDYRNSVLPPAVKARIAVEHRPRPSDRSDMLYSSADIKERRYWNDYMDAYEEMLNHTSTAWAPWHVVPANHKWFSRIVVADIIISKLESLYLSYPKVSKEQKAALTKAKEALKDELGDRRLGAR